MASLNEEQLHKFNKPELIVQFLKIQEENTMLKDTLKILQLQLTSLRSTVEKIQKNQEENKNERSNFNNELLVKRFIAVEKENYELQQYSRRDSLEVVGIPQTIPDEALEAKTCELFSKLDVSISPNDIQACHRLYDKNRIIVKFINRKSAFAILQSREKLKRVNPEDIGLAGSPRFYINESLCSHYRMLHGKLKGLYKNNHIFSFWVSNGSVRFKIDEFSGYRIARHLSDLEEEFGDLLNTSHNEATK